MSLETPFLITPDQTDLFNQTLNEMGNFAGSLEDPTLPSAIKKMIMLAQTIEGTNEAPSVLLTIAQIPGAAKVGSISNAIEAYGYFTSARRKSVVGKDGQLQASGHLVIEDLFVVCPDDAFVETCIQSACNGQNVGNVSLYYLSNIGTTAQVDFQIDITNARISGFYEGELVSAIGFGYDTMVITYFPVGDDAKTSGKVAAGFNLTTNAVQKA